jgi:predicted DNA-binding transcriptional regulator AlpA
MNLFSTREAARKLGITQACLSRYIAANKVPAPKSVTSGRMTLHLWTLAEIEHVRQLLPKIANGRKTRYKKKQSAVSTQQSAKTKKKAQARVPAPQKKK